MSRLKVVGGNQVTLLKNGAEYFPSLIEAIDAARADVRLETYIFHDDVIGRAVAAALTRAAGRGVNVKVLVDGFGSWRTPDALFQGMRDAGVKLMFFRKGRKLLDFRKSHLRRVHRKIVLVDGRVGFCGGINIVDDLTDCPSDSPRYDYAVRVEGPVLAEMYGTVSMLWRAVEWIEARKRKREDPTPAVSPAAAGPYECAFITRDNVHRRRDIERAYLTAIALAKKEILLVSPYFLPGRRFRRALSRAAKRGVTVTLLMQGQATDHPMLRWATEALYGRFLGAGVHVYVYEKSMLHGKVAAVDDNWATVGSSNLDPFSLFLNREANLAVLNGDFAKRLRDSVMEEVAGGAVKLDRDDWEKRGWVGKAMSWCAYSLGRWIAGVIGLSRQWN